MEKSILNSKSIDKYLQNALKSFILGQSRDKDISVQIFVRPMALLYLQFSVQYKYIVDNAFVSIHQINSMHLWEYLCWAKYFMTENWVLYTPWSMWRTSFPLLLTSLSMSRHDDCQSNSDFSTSPPPSYQGKKDCQISTFGKNRLYEFLFSVTDLPTERKNSVLQQGILFLTS